MEVIKENDNNNGVEKNSQNVQPISTQTPDISQFDPLNFSNFDEFCKNPIKPKAATTITKQRSIEIEVSPVIEPKTKTEIGKTTETSSNPQIKKQPFIQQSNGSDNLSASISKSISCETIPTIDVFGNSPVSDYKAPEKRRSRQHSFVSGRFTISKDEMTPIDEIFEDSPAKPKTPSNHKFEVDVEVSPDTSPKVNETTESSQESKQDDENIPRQSLTKQKSLEEFYQELLDF